MTNLVAWIIRAVVFGTVVLYGAIGETITEKVGHLNLGTPGIMCIGGAFGFVGAYSYEIHTTDPNGAVCILIALSMSFFASLLAGLVYSFLTVSLLINQNVVGLTMTIFGVGIGKFFGSYVIPEGAVSTKASFANSIFGAKMPVLSEMGFVGEIVFSYGFMMYLALLLAIITYLFMQKTRVGLNLRSIGENPATADAAGIAVNRYKYFAICIGSGITGLGGVYYVLDYSSATWATAAGDAIESLAWLSVALVIFVRWNTVWAILGSYLFGLCYWAYAFVPSITGISVNTDIAQILPYVVTIIVLIAGNMRKNKSHPGPAYLGQSYFREER